MSLAGRRQYVEQDRSDAISVRLISAVGEPITLAGSHTVAIYGPGGSEIVAATATGLTTSGSTATYTRTWAASTFARDHGYKALWTLSDGSTTYTRESFLSVVRRVFRSQLIDTDLTELAPYLSAQLVASSTFAALRNSAWERITQLVRARIPDSTRRRRARTFGTESAMGVGVDDYPGNIFHPEDFFEAHRLLTLSEFFYQNAITFAPGSEDASKGSYYERRGLELLDLVLSKAPFDRDDNGLMDTDEERFALNSIRIVR